MLKNRLFILLFINILFLFPALASEIDNEKVPCLFRITAPNTGIIYVLGSPHNVRIEDLLPRAAMEELTRIATQEHLFLLTEHKISNKDALLLLEHNKAKSNWALSVVTGNHNSLLDDKILIEESLTSNITIKDILNSEIWLAASILSTQRGLIFYPNFGGTEYNLETKAPWKSCWKGIGYLEGQEHFELLRDSSNHDKEFYRNWIKASLDTLVKLKSIIRKPEEAKDAQELKELTTEKEKALYDQNLRLSKSKADFKERGWEVVNENSEGIPEMVFLRNKSWIKTFMTKYFKLNKEKHPFLIIVGDGHLAATPDDKSFISYLIGALKPTRVERFINQTKNWKSVI